MVSYTRVPEIVSEPLTGGQPVVYVPEIVSEPLTGGQPVVYVPKIVSEPLTGGNPLVYCSLIFVEVLTAVQEEIVVTPVFPTLAGLAWSVTKTPTFSTKVASHSSGREIRAAFWQYPRYDFDLKYEFLSERQGSHDLKTMGGFFMQRQGSFDAFLYQDPNDYVASGDAMIATPGGLNLQYFFCRSFGGWVEPVGQVDFSVIGTFLPAAVNTTSEQIILTAHGLATGAGPFQLATTGGLPAPLAVLTPYWAIVVDANTIQLATTHANALASTAINLTTAGTGVHTLQRSFAAYVSPAETRSVPATSTYTITVNHPTIFLTDNGVTLAGVALAKVGSSPAANQYSVNTATGVYTFNVAQASASVVISYTYQAPTADYSLVMPNRLTFGAQPTGPVTADFQYHFTCRFIDDAQKYENFMENLWDLQKCSFRSVIL